MGFIEKKGFGSKWINLMMGCVTHPWYSIMHNGTSKGFFCVSRGFRQGDPLSHFLFSLVVDSLSALLLHVVGATIIKGYKILALDLTLSHLQFADDIIILAKPSSQAMSNLKHTLHVLEIISGFNVN